MNYRDLQSPRDSIGIFPSIDLPATTSTWKISYLKTIISSVIVLTSSFLSEISATYAAMTANPSLLVSSLESDSKQLSDQQRYQLSLSSIYKGMEYFKDMKVSDSAQRFRDAIDIYPPIKPNVWQLGLSEYYLKQYRECSDQFQEDAKSHKNDVEEVLWNMVCDKKGNHYASNEDYYNAYTVTDRRPIMKEIFGVYIG